jgi:hypothetical protein
MVTDINLKEAFSNLFEVEGLAVGAGLLDEPGYLFRQVSQR